MKGTENGKPAGERANPRKREIFEYLSLCLGDPFFATCKIRRPRMSMKHVHINSERAYKRKGPICRGALSDLCYEMDWNTHHYSRFPIYITSKIGV